VGAPECGDVIEAADAHQSGDASVIEEAKFKTFAAAGRPDRRKFLPGH